MKQITFPALNEELEDDCIVNQQFYNPLAVFQADKLKKQNRRIQYKAVFCKVLTFHDEQGLQQENSKLKMKQVFEDQNSHSDENLKKILQKSQPNNPSEFQQLPYQQIQPYSFNFDRKIKFHETPRFKCLLQTPLKIFNKNYNFEIQQLCISNSSKQKFRQVKRKQNPCLYYGKGASFFVGIALSYQKTDNVYESIFFLNLAVYVQPFNQKVWEEAISYVKKVGFWKNAYIWAKTAFLFIPCLQFAEQLFICGDKSQTPIHELRGFLSSLKNPQKYQKAIIQSAKLEIKNRKLWRGLTLLNNFKSLFYHRPFISYGVIILSKSLESAGYLELAIKFLKGIIQKGTSKFQAFSTYVQMKLRERNGQLQDRDINFLDSHTDNLTMETRYRLSLCLAQLLIKVRNGRYQQFINKAYNYAKKYCKGIGKQRAFRQIYFSLSSLSNISPKFKIIQTYKNDENLIFLLNKQKYLNGQLMTPYPFKNWKYYLHLALLGDENILMKAFQENSQGRLIAQAIHVLRLKVIPLKALKFWRQNIQKLPKSGELWCQGGRQIQNAIRCFKYAIHFTPQFGDSFIQLLKVYLNECNLLEVDQLRKNFLISQPYYGNVLSLLQLKDSNGLFRCSLQQVWNQAIDEIEQALYSNNFKNQLTACNSYNQYFQYPVNRTIRQILFSSYQQMDNKIVRN